jgi:hypothetical protein
VTRLSVFGKENKGKIGECSFCYIRGMLLCAVSAEAQLFTAGFLFWKKLTIRVKDLGEILGIGCRGQSGVRGRGRGGLSGSRGVRLSVGGQFQLGLLGVGGGSLGLRLGVGGAGLGHFQLLLFIDALPIAVVGALSLANKVVEVWGRI